MQRQLRELHLIPSSDDDDEDDEEEDEDDGDDDEDEDEILRDIGAVMGGYFRHQDAADGSGSITGSGSSEPDLEDLDYDLDDVENINDYDE